MPFGYCTFFSSGSLLAYMVPLCELEKGTHYPRHFTSMSENCDNILILFEQDTSPHLQEKPR